MSNISISRSCGLDETAKDDSDFSRDDHSTIWQELRSQLHKDGFVKVPRSLFCLEDETVEELRNEFEALFDGKYSTGIYPDEIHWRPGISRPDATRELCNAWKASTIIRKVVASRELGKIACHLSSTDGKNGHWTHCRIAQDDVIWKPAASVSEKTNSSSTVGFHQDGTYISDNFLPKSNNCLTLWMALDDADIENGCLQYAKGSHHWTNCTPCAENVHDSSFHVGDANPDTGDDFYMQSLKKAAKTAGVRDLKSVESVKVPKGELLVHHQDVWHGSPPNRSLHRLRRALVVHLLQGDVLFRNEPKPHYIYGRYWIRGEGGSLREDFFPITYSKDPSIAKRTEWLDDI